MSPLCASDTLATAEAMRRVGCKVDLNEERLIISPPTGGYIKDIGLINCGNSGTTMRLLAGFMTGNGIQGVLSGDRSLLGRPMGRIIDPLNQMGGAIVGTAGGTRAPLHIGHSVPVCISHTNTISSAQIKSAQLIASIRVGTTILEPSRSRDHTERMLRTMGATINVGLTGPITMAPTVNLCALNQIIPADFSSAAFWIVAATIVPGSDLTLPRVGLNPTRTGLIDILRAMGASIEVTYVDDTMEPFGTIRVRSAELHGVDVSGDLSLRAIDEIPVLMVAASVAKGSSTISDVAELRVKESDRLDRMTQMLCGMGAVIEQRADGVLIEGGDLIGGNEVDGRGDHRLGMSALVAGLVAQQGVSLLGAEDIATSYPKFAQTLKEVTCTR
jgi:3-phosphoshikimate 1-carboxyvinyltransferase